VGKEVKFTFFGKKLFDLLEYNFFEKIPKSKGLNIIFTFFFRLNNLKFIFEQTRDLIH
jgi:hypothetical protein